MWRYLNSAMLLVSTVVFGASAPPRLMLWQWERPEKGVVTVPRGAGVAYFIGQAFIEGANPLRVDPRRQPFRLAPGTYQMPVIRIDAREKPKYTPGQRRQIVQLVGEALEYTGAGAVQLDFDAPVSGRRFYRQVLEDVRRKIGPGVFLSMTALVSWCQEPDSWLRGLPVDEMVPMAFRMYNRELPPPRFAFPGCQGSIGVSLDTPHRPVKGAGRVYVFQGYYGMHGETLESVMGEMR